MSFGFERFDEIVSSKMKIKLESYGSSDAGVGDADGDESGAGVDIGYAPTGPAPRGLNETSVMLVRNKNARLARALLLLRAGLSSGCRTFPFLDELLDFLATFLSDTFVEV